jgi:hypothetical protein
MSTPVISGRVTLPQVTDTSRLTARGRKLALLFIMVTLLTFVVPLFNVDPPIMGKEHWSPLDIAVEIHNQLGADAPFFLIFVPYASTYCLLLLAGAMVCLLPSRKPLLWIIGLNLFLLLAPLRSIFGLMVLPSMLTSGKGNSPSLWLLLVILTSVIGFVVWKDTPV